MVVFCIAIVFLLLGPSGLLARNKTADDFEARLYEQVPPRIAARVIEFGDHIRETEVCVCVFVGVVFILHKRFLFRFLFEYLLTCLSICLLVCCALLFMQALHVVETRAVCVIFCVCVCACLCHVRPVFIFFCSCIYLCVSWCHNLLHIWCIYVLAFGNFEHSKIHSICTFACFFAPCVSVVGTQSLCMVKIEVRVCVCVCPVPCKSCTCQGRT